MNTKRQYSQPNCSLVLEGMEDVSAENVDILNGQSPMSILISAECNFISSNQKLSGGSIFLENLSHAVSRYAQEFLSGLPQPHRETDKYPQVTLNRLEDYNRHRLTFKPEPGEAEAKEIDLTTVELFDLVEAIDQFYLDRSTLPNMNLELQSVSKRYRQPEQPLSERLTPVVVGLTSLAMAAAAFFVIPPPEIEQPEATPAPINRTIETESETEPESNENPATTTEPQPESE